VNKIITVDGPAGSGKGKISKYIAKKYNFYHLDSGILYRRLAFELTKKGIEATDINKIKSFIRTNSTIKITKSVSLRQEKIGFFASEIAKFDFVRNYINSQQKVITKSCIKKAGFVIDGRDIGSVVFKNAFLKLYIEVDIIIRAKRRYKQLIDNGEKSIYRKILEDIKLRDKKDKTRKHSPLVIPKGAIIIDNSQSFRRTTQQIIKIIGNMN
tara:strand:- start:10194 stop:10829 length:636 start_codon:yes stop_codon:yes gene_type:complete